MIRFLIKSFSMHRWKVFLLFIISLVITVLSTLIPLFNGYFVDSLITADNYRPVFTIGAALILIGVLNVLFSFYENLVSVNLEKTVCFEINAELIKTIQSTKYSTIVQGQFDPAYINERINKDTATLVDFFICNFSKFGLCLIQIIAILIIISLISDVVLVFCLVFIPLYALIFILLKKHLLAWSINAKERSNKLINTLFLQLARLHSIKAEAAIPHSRDVMNTSFKKYLSCILKYTKVSNLYISLDAIVSVVFQALVIVVVGMKVIDKEISIGQYTMMISYFSFFAGCVKYYITLGQSRQEAMASYVRIREVLSLPQESPGRIPINKILNVEIDSLSFSYSGCKPLFNKFSFKFETNNVYLLTGDNGTGKSTLVDIIIGLRDDYSSGRILYNGIDIKEIDAFSLRKNNISIMLQSSIDEGIAVGEYFDEARVTSDQVSNFIKDNNLFSFYHFFRTDDIWSQDMKAFSRGEIQKIRLLRSLTKETANFLILDEPSSFMDFESSNELMSVLQSVRNDRIILLISHDPIYSESDFIKISI